MGEGVPIVLGEGQVILTHLACLRDQGAGRLVMGGVEFGECTVVTLGLVALGLPGLIARPS
jgi:hypothetical protein